MTSSPVLLERSSGLDIVTARGELDVLSVGRLRSVVFDPSLCGQHVLIVDLTDVAFIDARALGVLLATRRWTHARSAELIVVVKPASVVARVLAAASLEAVFTTVDTREEAVSRVERSRRSRMVGA